jgi:cytoskeletal protein CcmA (bactofilin family)
MLNMFKTTVALEVDRVKGKVEHVQIIASARFRGGLSAGKWRVDPGAILEGKALEREWAERVSGSSE